MKKTVLVLTFLAAGPIFADLGTQDTMNFLVTLRTELSSISVEKCIRKVCAVTKNQGNGSCQYLEELGIVIANMTPEGADKVSKFRCVQSVEEDLSVEPWPSVGRSN